MDIKQIYTANIFIVALFLVSLTVKAEHAHSINLSLGGRLKVDGIYNADSIGGIRTSKSDLAFSPASIPVPDMDRNSFDANLRESRVWATLTIPLAEDSLATYIEFDFFDTKKDSLGRSHVANEPRMRHLYSSFKNITIGKTYTTFANLSAFPEINDNNGPVGNLLIRHELVRYNTSLSWAEIFLALEKGESSFTSSTGSSFQANNDQFPDIIGKIKFSEIWGNVTAAFMLREINANNKMMVGVNNKKWGAAFSASGKIYFPKQDNLRFTVSYGNVLGKYMSFNAFNDAAIDNAGRVNLTEILSAHIAYQHWWTSTLRSSWAIGAGHANQDSSIVPFTVNKVFTSSHVNLLWSPIRKLTLGMEWLHGYRELENGDDGHMDRIQFSVVYKY